MKSIERGLAEIHRHLMGSNTGGPSVTVTATSNGHTNGTTNGSSSGDSLSLAVGDEQAFAVVGFVNNGSPADIAVSMTWIYIIMLKEFGCLWK